MMLATRLVNLIESHSDHLASTLLEKVLSSEFTTAYHNVPPEELQHRVHEIYEHLGDWLLGKSDLDIEKHYREIGVRRYKQRVPLAELVWSITMTKENLWEFLSWECVPDRLMEVFGELELLQLLGRFFDRAIHFAVMGYEQAAAGDRANGRNGRARARSAA